MRKKTSMRFVTFPLYPMRDAQSYDFIFIQLYTNLVFRKAIVLVAQLNKPTPYSVTLYL